MGDTMGGLDFGDRNAAFVRFKREVEDGRLLGAALKERAAQLRDLKASIKVWKARAGGWEKL